MTQPFTKLSPQAAVTLSETDFTELLQRKRRTLMIGKKATVPQTCNRLNRRRWAKKMLRRYTLKRKHHQEEQDQTSET